MNRPIPAIRRRNRGTPAALLLIATATTTLAACGNSDGDAGSDQTPASPITADSITVPVTDAPPVTESTVRSLPPEPLVLYEWYPAGENTKTIIVSDDELTAPPVRVVPKSDGAAVHSSWSRDGSQFTWEVLRGNDTASVWTANADGSEPVERVACEEASCVEMSYPAFSPDDSQLLVTRFDIADDGDWGASHLVVVDLATGKQTIIASTADGTASFYSATWSPDGSNVAAQLETYPDASQSTIAGSAIVVVDTDPATSGRPEAPDGPGAVRRATRGGTHRRPHPLRVVGPRRISG